MNESKFKKEKEEEINTKEIILKEKVNVELDEGK